MKTKPKAKEPVSENNDIQIDDELWAELERRRLASEADPSRLLTQEQFDARLDECIRQRAKKRA